MNIILLNKSLKKGEKVQDEKKKKISISSELYGQLKREADKRKVKISELISLILAEFLNQNKRKQQQAERNIQNGNNSKDTSKYNKREENTVWFETMKSIQKDQRQENKQVNGKSSSSVIDMGERLLEKAGNELEAVWGTLDQERCKQEYRRLLREQKRKEHDYHGE